MRSCPRFFSNCSPVTKQFTVLRAYFQWLPLALSGSGEKVNEFNTVSHDSPYSGRSERRSGPQQHVDEGTAVEENVAAPRRGRSACAGLVRRAGPRQAGEMSAFI